MNTENTHSHQTHLSASDALYRITPMCRALCTLVSEGVIDLNEEERRGVGYLIDCIGDMALIAKGETTAEHKNSIATMDETINKIFNSSP